MFSLEINKELKLALVEPSFATRYLELVEYERDYLSQMLAWPAHAHSEEFFLTFIENSIQDYEKGISLTCAMIFQNELVGNVSLNKIDHPLKKAEIGYWLSSKYQGNGLVTKSVSSLINYSFCTLNLDKVQISAAKENQSSRAVAERLQMSLEGLITNSENINGRIVDHAIYGLNKRQWEKR